MLIMKAMYDIKNILGMKEKLRNYLTSEHHPLSYLVKHQMLFQLTVRKQQVGQA